MAELFRKQYYLPGAAPDPPLHWIHVQGTLPADTLELIDARLGLHALALEDVLNTGVAMGIWFRGQRWF